MGYKKIIVLVLIIAVFFFGIVFLVNFGEKTPEPTPEPEEEKLEFSKKIIGESVEGRKIESYTIGNGKNHILFVGGIHGGYEWNSILLADRFIDYVEDNSDLITENLTISVIPNLNPDGVFKVIQKEGKFSISDVSVDREGSKPGRFNGNNVDLNRNFDCKWQPESTWQSNVVSAGSQPFSEPEAQALRDFVLSQRPDAVVFWHSQANAVYASECEEGILPGTLEIMNAYSQATGYQAVDTFDAYEITGDAEGWLASIGIPAITVELETHETVEWDKNKLGILALLEYFK